MISHRQTDVIRRISRAVFPSLERGAWGGGVGWAEEEILNGMGDGSHGEGGERGGKLKVHFTSGARERRRAVPDAPADEM